MKSIATRNSERQRRRKRRKGGIERAHKGTGFGGFALVYCALAVCLCRLLYQFAFLLLCLARSRLVVTSGSPVRVWAIDLSFYLHSLSLYLRVFYRHRLCLSSSFCLAVFRSTGLLLFLLLLLHRRSSSSLVCCCVCSTPRDSRKKKNKRSPSLQGSKLKTKDQMKNSCLSK